MEKKSEIELLGAYLINGQDHLKRDRAISKLKMRLETLGDLSFNLDTFDGSQSQGSQIIDACSTIPFACEKRLVIVNDADKLSKDAQTEIVEYLKSPNPTTVLLLVADKLSANSKLFKQVVNLDKKAVIDCSPVKPKDLTAHVRQMAPRHGIALTQGAAKALVELVGNDTLHLDGELEKIALTYSDKNEITEAEVRSIVARVNEPKPWHFVNAMSSRNVKDTLEMLSNMKSSSPISLLYQCVMRIRELICTKCLFDDKTFSASELASVLNVDQQWKVEKFGFYASKFSLKELKDALESSLDCEREMKSGADADAAFRMWIVEFLTNVK